MNGHSLKFYREFETMDLTLTAKDNGRTDVLFSFENEREVSFSILNNAWDGNDHFMIQSMPNIKNPLTGTGWATQWNMSEDEINAFKSEDGIDFRIVREGAKFYLYLGENLRTELDFTGEIGTTTLAEVYIRHYSWTDDIGTVLIPISFTGKIGYDRSLFYRNDIKTSGADPFIFDNTERDGYYYLYNTKGSCYCYRSKNLMDWESVGNTISISGWSDIWAPEVVYDSEEKLYYMFFSGTPTVDESVEAGNGVAEGTAKYQMLVAVSKYPDKDFEIIDFSDASSCGDENLHQYDTSKYPHNYTKYLFMNPDDYNVFANATGGTDSGYGGYTCCIDPHPFIDENGDKYLFWTDNVGLNRINGVKMENWLKPDWSTATVLTYSQYYTVDDWKTAQAGETVEDVSYENDSHTVNEGPVVTEHNGKYYLTFSVNAYSDNSYQVCQAVADSPLGPYRKLTEEEGGILLSGNAAGSQEISGTGHHSFVVAGEQMYVVYHRHSDFATGGNKRNTAIDEVKWITVKDKVGNDLEVMYVNGPTCTIQPAIEAYSAYRNIADEATVSGGSDVSYLTDGLLSSYKLGNETIINKTTTFTFDFVSARSTGGVMVYNSKLAQSCFTNVSKIEFVCVEDGKEVVRSIENIKFSSEHYNADELGNITYVTPGAAAYTEIDEWNVKSIRITVEVPEGQDTVGISEIKILGKK